MKNLKFGALFLGLILAVGSLVTVVSAQTARVQVAPRADRNVVVLDGRGSELGVMVSDLDPSTRQSPQADSGSLRAGVRIDEVNPDSPAEKAGIKAGDIIVEFDGEKVRSARQFTRLVQETPEGRSVSIALMRDGKKQTVNATPDSGRMTWNSGTPGFGPDVERALRDAERGMREYRFQMPEPRTFEYRVPGDMMPFMARPRPMLGVQVQSMSRDLEEYFGVKNGGALVSSVTPDSAASKAGMKAGDVIISVNGRSVTDADDLINQIEDINGEATIVVVRDRKEMTLQATIERPRPQAPRAGSRPGI
jgi:serine protease Do